MLCPINTTPCRQNSGLSMPEQYLLYYDFNDDSVEAFIKTLPMLLFTNPYLRPCRLWFFIAHSAVPCSSRQTDRKKKERKKRKERKNVKHIKINDCICVDLWFPHASLQSWSISVPVHIVTYYNFPKPKVTSHIFLFSLTNSLHLRYSVKRTK